MLVVSIFDPLIAWFNLLANFRCELRKKTHHLCSKIVADNAVSAYMKVTDQRSRSRGFFVVFFSFA